MKEVNINKVIKICEDMDLASNSRKRELVYSRTAVYNFLRVNTHYSLSKIGEFLGGRTHATVSSGLDTYKYFTDINDKIFLFNIRDVERRLSDCFYHDYDLVENKYTSADMQEYAEFCIMCFMHEMPNIVAEDWYNHLKNK